MLLEFNNNNNIFYFIFFKAVFLKFDSLLLILTLFFLKQL